MEELPLVTIAISTIMLATFLFTSNFLEKMFNPEAESYLKDYERLFGFVPARPKMYSFITYTFIHADFFHLIGNLIFFLIVGIALENRIGKIPFLAIYISSGCTAISFDIVQRILLGISMEAPFVGASGSIFGLFAVASLTRPLEKIPTYLVILSFLPFLQLLLFLPISGQFSQMFLFLALPIVFLAFVFLPKNLPFFTATILFIISWIFYFFFNISPTVSHLGHLGGVIGGFLSMLLFPKES
ncbi:MAG: rhomboid family intramembrane serine protease [Candidatus Aenigmatarchaeota archaeon]